MEVLTGMLIGSIIVLIYYAIKLAQDVNDIDIY